MIRRWHSGEEFADLILAQHRQDCSLPGRDRAFAQELFYGVLRNRSLLDFWLAQMHLRKLGAVARDILRLGFYQLFFLGTKPHAAVHETVNLAKRSQRGFVNAVLRAALREEPRLRAAAERQPVALQFSHPPFLVEKWERQLGSEATRALCRWDNEPAPVYARRGGEFVRLEDAPDGLSGAFYIQDPSTALAPQLLAPQLGELVLDACAAPGGKCALLAEQLAGTGKIVATDRAEGRLQRLQDNLLRLGIENVELRRVDWQEEASPFPPGSFDKILLDAPCTNTGVMRRRVDVRWRLRPEDFVRMPALQLAILQKVAPLLKPGGALVYSTCSLEAEENEQVMENFLHAHPDFRLTKTETSLPWRDRFDGAFAARLQKSA